MDVLNGIRRSVQVPIRVVAAVAGGLLLFAAVAFLFGAIVIYPRLAPISLLCAWTGLVAFRVSISNLGVERVPRKTLLVLGGASGWFWSQGVGPAPLQWAVGLFCSAAAAALVVDLAFRTSRDSAA